MSSRAGLVLQLASGEGGRRYLELGPDELRGIAAVLERLLRASGVGRGHRLLAYDFSTSLNVLALTRAYAPGLEVGACDSIGCSVISLDGLPSLASRTAYFYKLLRPDFLMVRRELLAPLRSKMEGSGLGPTIIVSSQPEPAEAPGASSTRTLYVLEEALFMALLSGDRITYVDDLYDYRCEGGVLAVRPRFARGLGFARTSIRCAEQEVRAV